MGGWVAGWVGGVFFVGCFAVSSPLVVPRSCVSCRSLPFPPPFSPCLFLVLAASLCPSPFLPSVCILLGLRVPAPLCLSCPCLLSCLAGPRLCYREEDAHAHTHTHTHTQQQQQQRRQPQQQQQRQHPRTHTHTHAHTRTHTHINISKRSSHNNNTNHADNANKSNQSSISISNNAAAATNNGICSSSGNANGSGNHHMMFVCGPINLHQRRETQQAGESPPSKGDGSRSGNVGIILSQITRVCRGEAARACVRAGARAPVCVCVCVCHAVHGCDDVCWPMTAVSMPVDTLCSCVRAAALVPHRPNLFRMPCRGQVGAHSCVEGTRGSSCPSAPSSSFSLLVLRFAFPPSLPYPFSPFTSYSSSSSSPSSLPWSPVLCRGDKCSSVTIPL